MEREVSQAEPVDLGDEMKEGIKRGGVQDNQRFSVCMREVYRDDIRQEEKTGRIYKKRLKFLWDRFSGVILA